MSRNKGVSSCKRNLRYEGKAKKVFETDDPDLLIIDYKDDITACDGKKKETSRIKALSTTG